MYVDLHQHPELSGNETQTAAKVAAALKAQGYSVTEHVGGTGVVAILDPRLRTRPYGRAFLQALPRCPVAEEPAAVAAFFGGSMVVSA